MDEAAAGIWRSIWAVDGAARGPTRHRRRRRVEPTRRMAAIFSAEISRFLRGVFGADLGIFRDILNGFWELFGERK